MDKEEPALGATAELRYSQWQHFKLLCAVPGKPQGHCGPALQASYPPAVSFILVRIMALISSGLNTLLSPATSTDT